MVILTDGIHVNLNAMDNEEFRRYGHQVVEWIADYLEDIRQYPVLPDTRPGDVIDRLPGLAARAASLRHPSSNPAIRGFSTSSCRNTNPSALQFGGRARMPGPPAEDAKRAVKVFNCVGGLKR